MDVVKQYVGEPKTDSPANAVEAIHRRLLVLTKSIGMNADRTQHVIDRMQGAAPSPSNPAKPKEVRGGSLGAINDLLDEIEASAQFNSVALDAMDNLA